MCVRRKLFADEPGDYFAPHFDGNFTYEDGPRKGDTSFMTVLLYLNEPKLGGETSIMIGDHHVQVTPRAGSALIFDHDLLHQGEVLHEGTKVVVRTDVMVRFRHKSSLLSRVTLVHPASPVQSSEEHRRERHVLGTT